MRQVQGCITIFWTLMIPVSYATGWVDRVSYVSGLSLWALVASHGAWWAAASVETKQMEEDLSTEVVDAMIEETDVKRAKPLSST